MPIVVTALALLRSTEGQSQLLCLLAMTTVFLLLRIFCDLLTLELQKESHAESRPRRCCGVGPARDGAAQGWVRTVSVAETGRDRGLKKLFFELSCPGFWNQFTF